MKYNEVIDNLQNLTMSKINTTELAQILNMPVRTLYTRSYRNSEVTPFELKKIEDFYNVNLFKSDTQTDKNFKNTTHTYTFDYYPDIFGSCGTGEFVLSPEKQQIQVPDNVFFKKFSKVKKYSVINAQGAAVYIFRR